MKSNRNVETASQKTNPMAANQVLVIQKGHIFNEMERLKSLDNHRQKLDTILSRDARANVRKTVDRYDPKKLDENRQKRLEYNQQSKSLLPSHLSKQCCFSVTKIY